MYYLWINNFSFLYTSCVSLPLSSSACMLLNDRLFVYYFIYFVCMSLPLTRFWPLQAFDFFFSISIETVCWTACLVTVGRWRVKSKVKNNGCWVGNTKRQLSCFFYNILTTYLVVLTRCCWIQTAESWMWILVCIPFYVSSFCCLGSGVSLHYQNLNFP